MAKKLTRLDGNILALDPGKTTGWALFSNKGVLVNSGEIPDDFVMNWIEAIEPTIIVIEDFKINPAKRQGGSDVPAAQVIGAVKAYCKWQRAKLVLQSNTIKPIAYKWAGLRTKSHAHDAVAHGWYYCQRSGIRKSRLLDESSEWPK